MCLGKQGKDAGRHLRFGDQTRIGYQVSMHKSTEALETTGDSVKESTMAGPC